MTAPCEWTRGGWRKVPYFAREFPVSHDKVILTYEAYYENRDIDTFEEGDTQAVPKRCYEDDNTVPADDGGLSSSRWTPFFVYAHSYGNQISQDNGIIYERHNNGVRMLHVWDVKRQYGCGSEDQGKCSWKLSEVSGEECKLEIDKKTVRFSFAGSETDKLMLKVVDGYEVKYQLRTDAMRVELEIELVLSTVDVRQDSSNDLGEIKLEIEPGCEPHTITLLNGLHPIPNKKMEGTPPRKISKLERSAIFEYSTVLIVPRNLRPDMKLVVDGSDSLPVKPHMIFVYNIPVDQHEHIHFKNGCIRLKLFWGCRLDREKGVCTGVCTCEPGEFIGFPKPSEEGCTLQQH